MFMLLILQLFILISNVRGNVSSSDNRRLIYLPRIDNVNDEDGFFKNNERYCYRMSWLGGNFDQDTFIEVKNKNCTEYFGNNKEMLCIDPMVVTVSGREPDLVSARKKHYREVTCRLSNDQVCAKYTIYYNNVPARVVRYCTRIDIADEGPMVSGCLTQKRGSWSHEVCACKSGYGVDGICNGTSKLSVKYVIFISIFSYYIIRYIL